MPLLTARRAIKQHCIECCGRPGDVKECRILEGSGLPECILHPHRLGRPKGGKKDSPTSVIRRFCVNDCCNGCRAGADDCEDGRCNLYYWRMGHSPEPHECAGLYLNESGAFVNRRGKVFTLPKSRVLRAERPPQKGDFHHPETGGESL